MSFMAIARAQRHKGVDCRKVAINGANWSGWSPVEAMEIALTILDAARKAETAECPEYPGLHEERGDPLNDALAVERERADRAWNEAIEAAANRVSDLPLAAVAIRSLRRPTTPGQEGGE